MMLPMIYAHVSQRRRERGFEGFGQTHPEIGGDIGGDVGRSSGAILMPVASSC